MEDNENSETRLIFQFSNLISFLILSNNCELRFLDWFYSFDSSQLQAISLVAVILHEPFLVIMPEINCVQISQLFDGDEKDLTMPATSCTMSGAFESANPAFQTLQALSTTHWVSTTTDGDSKPFSLADSNGPQCSKTTLLQEESSVSNSELCSPKHLGSAMVFSMKTCSLRAFASFNKRSPRRRAVKRL